MRKIRLPDIHSEDFDAAYEAVRAVGEKVLPSTKAKALK